MFPSDTGIKRTLCKFFEAGTCTKDVNCGFAHGDEELGQPVPRAAVELPLAGRVPARSVGVEAVKRSLCKFWEEGNCEKGQHCTWAHGAHELGTGAPQAAPRVHVQQYIPISKAPIMVTAAPNQEKRTICKFWEEGKCQRGDACGFIHGDELATTTMIQEQPLPEKRTICKFWQENRCDKGRTCTFAHGSAELAGRTVVHAAAPPIIMQPVGITAKTNTVCKFWLQGDCQRSHACQFSHASPGGRPLVGQSPALQLHPSITAAQVTEKRTICKFWLQEKCDKADNCTFAHGDAELGQPAKRARLEI